MILREQEVVDESGDEEHVISEMAAEDKEKLLLVVCCQTMMTRVSCSLCDLKYFSCINIKL